MPRRIKAGSRALSTSFRTIRGITPVVLWTRTISEGSIFGRSRKTQPRTPCMQTGPMLCINLRVKIPTPYSNKPDQLSMYGCYNTVVITEIGLFYLSQRLQLLNSLRSLDLWLLLFLIVFHGKEKGKWRDLGNPIIW